MLLCCLVSDTLKQKIGRVPLDICFPEYKGPNEYQPALDFITQKFKSTRNVPIVFGSALEEADVRAAFEKGLFVPSTASLLCSRVLFFAQ